MKLPRIDNRAVFIGNHGLEMIVVPGGAMLLHRYIAEKTLGRSLKGHVVHHINEDRHDHRLENLLVLENDAEHRRLHARMNLVKKGGVVGRDKFCAGCNSIKPLVEFHNNRTTHDGKTGWCGVCNTARVKRYEETGTSIRN